MKRFLWIVLVVVMGVVVNLSFAQDAPEVSKRKDVSVFAVYSSVNMPEAATMYFDNKLNAKVKGLGRFNVIGFQYRMDSGSVAKFIEKVKKLKREKIENDESLIDEDFGVVVIPAEQMFKMVNSFFVFLPSISGWRTWNREIKAKRNSDGVIIVKAHTEYLASATLSIKIITADGNLMDVYNSTVEKKSKKSSTAAYQKAVDGALAGLILWLRNTDEFKLKTRVLKREGGKVALELGKDLGLKAGYEFKIQSTESLGGDSKFKMTSEKGLVRVMKVGDNFSWGRIILGNPQPNMQLIEAPMANVRVALVAGVMPMASDITSLIMKTKTGASVWSNTFTPLPVAIDVGLDFGIELGYAAIAKLTVGALINSPLAFYVDLGVGYELYLGPFSILPELSISGALVSFDMGTAYYYSGYSYTKGTVDIMGIHYGIKPKISFNIQFSQNFKLGAYALYGLYLDGIYSIEWKSDSDSEDTQSFELTDLNVYKNGSTTATDTLAQDVKIGGLGFGVQAMLRF